MNEPTSFCDVQQLEKKDFRATMAKLDIGCFEICHIHVPQWEIENIHSKEGR